MNFTERSTQRLCNYAMSEAVKAAHQAILQSEHPELAQDKVDMVWSLVIDMNPDTDDDFINVMRLIRDGQEISWTLADVELMERALELQHGELYMAFKGRMNEFDATFTEVPDSPEGIRDSEG